MVSFSASLLSQFSRHSHDSGDEPIPVSYTTSIPGTFEDFDPSLDTVAAQLETVHLEDTKDIMANPLEEIALTQLQNGDQESLLDAIDELRSQGISHHINLPQLIVCGDQSSGKSSLLEAITQLPFPTKDGICTTFATEVALRRSARSEVKISIRPGPSRNDSEKIRLRRFNATFTNAAEFPDLIDEAKRYMNPVSETLDKSINDDVLHLEISGPKWAPLTIVDLPGLIQSEARGQTAEDVTTVRRLVREYMQNPRSIILAVIAANYDFANQGILSLAKEVDPTGTRTLGIITKPDRVPEGSGDEKVVVNLAKNQEHHLQLEWHVIRNRDHSMRDCTSEERDNAEKEFFSKGIWRTIPQTHVGVDYLRNRLGRILLQQIRKELPELVEEINRGMAECQSDLDKLGDPRNTPRDQRTYLVNISKSFEMITREAINGMYENGFFPRCDSTQNQERRLRATIRNFNEKFAYVMQIYGHCKTIVETQDEAGEVDNQSNNFSCSLESVAPKPQVILRSEYLDEVKEIVRKNRGCELPGTFNPLLINELFRNQSTPWTKIAREHVDIVWHSSINFLETLLGSLTNGYAYNTIFEEVIHPAMDKKRKLLLEKVDELMKPYRSKNLTTYHPRFVESIQHLKKKQQQHGLLQSLVLRYGTSAMQTTAAEIAQFVASTDDDKADQYASAELLYCMEVYYKVALSTFVDNVCTLGVESCLVEDLPEMFSPKVVANMDDEKLALLASESREVQEERRTLEERLKSLKQGAKIVGRQARHASPTDAIFRRRTQATGVNSTVSRTVPTKRPVTPPLAGVYQPVEQPEVIPDLTSNAFPPTPPASPERDSKATSHNNKADGPDFIPGSPHPDESRSISGEDSDSDSGSSCCSPTTPMTSLAMALDDFHVSESI